MPMHHLLLLFLLHLLLLLPLLHLNFIPLVRAFLAVSAALLLLRSLLQKMRSTLTLRRLTRPRNGKEFKFARFSLCVCVCVRVVSVRESLGE